MSTPTTYPIRSYKKALAGYSLAVIGSVLALSAGGVLAAFGLDGEIGVGSHLLSTPATAVVSSVTSIKHTHDTATFLGQPKLRISAAPVQGTSRVFVGIGPAADVDRYLAGVATQQSTDLNMQTTASSAIRHNPRANPQPPGTQQFWVARASSTRTAAVNWKVRDGQYRVVIMSANGHGGFAATTSIGITIPNIADYAIAAILLGLLIAAGGTAMVLRANRQPRNGSSIPSPSSAAATSAV
jgi:hypothetical protein